MEQRYQRVTGNEAGRTSRLPVLHPEGGEDFQLETDTVPCLLQRMPCEAAQRMCQSREQGRRKGKAEGTETTQKSTAEVRRA